MVIVKPAPRADAGKDQVICYGENVVLEGNGGLVYSWTPAMYLSDKQSKNPVSLKPASTLEYALMVTDASGCSSVQPDTVKITVTIPKIFAGHDTSVQVKQPFHLRAVDINNSGFVEYNWQPSTGLNNAHVADPVATLERNTTYRVTARTLTGCEGSDEVNIKTYKAADIIVPNAFTPNQDGHNDYAKPILLGIQKLTDFTIYNRWGGVVYRFTPGSKGWDGLLNGVVQSTALFSWIAEGIDFHGTVIKRSGTLMLIR
jgi:gliding motility-associated-like protein